MVGIVNSMYLYEVLNLLALAVLYSGKIKNSAINTLIQTIRAYIMKIESIEIKGLHGDKDIKIDFNNDLNIITGRNGAGKSSVLTIIWLIISFNFNRVRDNYNFRMVRLKTSEYALEFSGNLNNRSYFILDKNGQLKNVFRESDLLSNKGVRNKSLFFPTYRRIESKVNKDMLNLSNTLEIISDSLSMWEHKFITSVGTKDIELLFYKRYSTIVEEINALNEDLPINPIDLFDFLESQSVSDEQKRQVRDKLKELKTIKDKKMKPIEVFKQTVAKFIKHSSITLGEKSDTETLKIGDAVDAISSDLLSAGEKQMLSFIAYNTFYEDTIFIIDEPELSLHVDWQRQLIPTLLEQGTSNQFILATHSPFIYANYPDKEIQLLDDKGNSENIVEKSQSNKYEG